MLKATVRLATVLFAAMCFVGAPHAQTFDLSSAPTPPVRSSVDERGVDVISGRYYLSEALVSVGAPDAGQLTHTASGDFPNDLYEGKVDAVGSVYTVTVGATAETFTSAGGVYTSSQARGSTFGMQGGTYVYTVRDGTVLRYSTALAGYANGSSPLARLVSITTPDGRVVSINYRSASLVVGNLGTLKFFRIQSVTSNFGYQLKYSYRGDNLAQSSDINDWHTRTAYTGLNNAVDYCGATDNACTFSRTWPTVLASGTSVIDALGRTTTYAIGTAANSTSTITRPSGVATTIVRDANGRVASWSNGGGTWTYSYLDSGSTRTTTVTDPLGHTRVVTSDTNKFVVLSDKDALNNVSSFEYDTYGRLTKETRPEGNFISYTYDARGNVTQKTMTPKAGSGLAAVSVFAGYDTDCANIKTCNKPNWTKDARGNQTDYTYDATHGGVLTVTRPSPSSGVAGPQTRYTYLPTATYAKDATGSLVQVGSPYLLTQVSSCMTTSSCIGGADETKISYSRSGANNGLVTATTRASGNGGVSAVSTFGYDDVGNQVTVDGPLTGSADTTRTYYDALRRVVGVIGPDPDGVGSLLYRASRTSYDVDGAVTSVEVGTATGQADSSMSSFAALQQSIVTYDPASRKASERMIAGGATQRLTHYSYDGADRLICVALRMNAVFAPPPSDACTPATAGQDGPDRITRFTYDNANRVTQVTSGYGATEALDERTATYTANGQEQTAADGKGNLTTFEYDGFDRLTKARYPNTSGGGSSTTDYEQYSYDAAGNRTSWRRRDGSTVAFTYDGLNRANNGLRGEVFAYDNLGRRISATYSGQSSATGYDALGRVTSETTNGSIMSYQYDPAGRRTRITWPDSVFVTYAYNTADDLTGILQNGSTSLASISYDNLGQPSTVTRGNGTSLTYTYDAASRLVTLSHDLAGSASDQTWTFAYNAADQVRARTATNSAYEWTSVPPSWNYTSNGLNQYTALSGGTITYDTRGNLANDGSKTYGYDLLNNLTSVSNGVTLAYEPTGRLSSVTTSSAHTRLLYAGSDLVAELSDQGAILRRYVPGLGVDAPLVWYEGSGTSDRRWLMADPLGSIVSVANDAGAVTAINTYDEYGRPGAGNVGRFQYTGRAWVPEIGLYHYKARAYAPNLGRFMQTDPIGYDDGMNWYAYVGNDPINAIDPSGLDGFQGNAGNGTANNPWQADPVTVNAGCLERYGCFSYDRALQICGYSCTNQQAAFRLTYNAEYERNQWMWAPVLAPVAVVGGLQAAAIAEEGGLAQALFRGAVRACRCFEAGTPVATANGPTAIEEIKVGDLVLSRDEDSGVTAFKHVTALIPGRDDRIWDVTVKTTGSYGVRSEVIHTTEEHPFRAADGGWTPAAQLKPGSMVVTSGGVAKVLSVAQTDRTARTYNFEVEDFHTYFVGNGLVLVHNACFSAAENAGLKQLFGQGVNGARLAASRFMAGNGTLPAGVTRATLQAYKAAITAAGPVTANAPVNILRLYIVDTLLGIK